LKDRILNNAREKFIKDGYTNVNMDDLARSLGISKRTLYENFESKKTLFYEVVKTTFEEAYKDADEILERMTKDGEYRFFEEIKNLWELIIYHTKFFNLRFQDDIKKYAPNATPFCQMQKIKEETNFHKVFELGIKTGNIKPSINIDIFRLVYFSSMKNILNPEIIADLSLSTNEVIEQIYDLLMLGVLSDTGKKEYNKILQKEEI